MSRFIPLILASGLISFIATPLLRRLALSLNFTDDPEARKLHITPVPMLGGVAIYLGVMSAMALSTGQQTHINELIGVIAGATVVTGFGLWDDRFGMSPPVKMLGQIVATGLLIWSGISVSVFQIEWLNIAITILWVVGISNAINFLDNMDGLAAGITTVASGFFLAMAAVEGLGLVASLAAATLGACIGFLYYNFNPASLFMGDAGSLLLGFVLAVLGIKLEFAGRPANVTWMIPVVILAMPIFDTTLVVISRLLRGKHVYQGGKDHTSHRLVSVFKMTQARAVMTLYMAAGALGLIAFMLRDANSAQGRIILAGLAALFVLGIVWLEWNFDEDAPPPIPES